MIAVVAALAAPATSHVAAPTSSDAVVTDGARQFTARTRDNATVGYESRRRRQIGASLLGRPNGILPARIRRRPSMPSCC